MLKRLWNKIMDIIEGKRAVSKMSIEEMKAIKLDDIPFKYDQTRKYFEMAGVENLCDLLLGQGVWVALSWVFLTNPRYLVDVEDTVNREYGRSMFEHIAGFDFGNSPETKPIGFCIMVHDIIKAYKAGKTYKMMPLERFKLCINVWNAEETLNHCYAVRQIFLKYHKPGEEDKVRGWWPTEKYLEDCEARLMAAIKKVEEWDKEHDYDNGLLYVC